MTARLTHKRHADLVDRMATTLGLDLEEKIMEGKLQIDSLGDVVLRCTGCTDPEGCEAWLDAQGGDAPEAPGMCRNADLFEMLKKGKRV